jgi:hypothetical protein
MIGYLPEVNIHGKVRSLSAALDCVTVIVQFGLALLVIDF